MGHGADEHGASGEADEAGEGGSEDIEAELYCSVREAGFGCVGLGMPAPGAITGLLRVEGGVTVWGTASH